MPSFTTLDTPHTYDDIDIKHLFSERKRKFTSTTTSILFASSMIISSRQKKNFIKIKNRFTFTHINH